MGVREDVRALFSAVARSPRRRHPFPVGRAFAESLGYPAELLASLPAAATDAFTGASCLSAVAEVPAGSTVLDLGCGAGLDALIAARRAAGVRVVGLDFSAAMLARARRAAREAGAADLHLLRADAEALPLARRSVDVLLANGILNLNPRRAEILREMARVLRERGAAWSAELVLREPLRAGATARPADWFT